MSRDGDGGAAFPCERDYGMKLESQEGMSLRDYFAAKAMQSLIINTSTCSADVPISVRAYELSDAMLKAREA